MNDVDRALQVRFHRAGDEMAARPLHSGGGLGERMPRRTLGPAVAALALAAVLAVVAGLGVHNRLATTRHSAPATKPPAAPSPAVATPQPSPQWQSAPFSSASVAWDSTHRNLVAFAPADIKSGDTAGHVWIWDAAGWRELHPATAPDMYSNGVLVDMPALHGVALLGEESGRGIGGSWLWDGSAWRALPAAGFDQCLAPNRAAWDQRHHQVVTVLLNMCSGGTNPTPPQTWTWDGRVWQRHADTSGVLTNGGGPIAWDPTAGSVVMGGLGAREWAWSGSTWRAVRSSGAAVGTEVGAAWDAQAAAVLAYGPPSWDSTMPGRLVAMRNGVITQLASAEHPERVLAVVADGTDNRLLAIGQELVPDGQTPSPGTEGNAYFVFAWTGQSWEHITYAGLSGGR